MMATMEAPGSAAKGLRAITIAWLVLCVITIGSW
jgi:hypothetical protein